MQNKRLSTGELSTEILDRLKTDGVYVVTRQRTDDPDKLIGVVMTLDAAAALVIDDADFWLDEYPVSVTDRDIWMPNVRWKDESLGHAAYCFGKGQGEMTFLWCGEDYGYRVQWSALGITYG
jgi:hypothetical protein